MAPGSSGRLEPPDRCLADDEVAGQVVAQEGEHREDVVVAPRDGVLGNPQEPGLRPRELAAQETLRLHVGDEVRQALEEAVLMVVESGHSTSSTRSSA